MTTAVFAGFYLSFSLILAIGAQNAFILRQGVRRMHVLPLVITCGLSDAILIVIGVSSFGVISEVMPWISPILRFGGAAFLFFYGLRSFWAAWKGGEALEAAGDTEQSLRAAILTCLALTFLNPHVYLDTVVLIGTISTQYDPHRFAFGVGAATASIVFFFLLGFGARSLAPFFARPNAWRFLDVLVGGVMWALAAKLVLMP